MPLKIGVEHKAVVSILRSFNTFKAVLTSIQQLHLLKNDDIHLANAKKDVSGSLRALYPDDYDLENEDADSLVNQKYNNKIIEVYDDISQSIFIVDNGKIFLKQNKLSDYNLYSTLLDTYPFFAYFLLQRCKDLLDTDRKLNYLNSYIDESFRFYGNLENHISQITDPHIHMGAALDFHYRINNILLKPEDQDFSRLPDELFFHLHPAISTNIFFHLFSLLESVLIHSIINPSSKNHRSLETVLQWLIDCSEQQFNANDLEDDINELRHSYSSIRSGEISTQYTSPIDNNFLEGLIQKALGYFAIDSSNNNPKLGDKTIILFFLSVLENGDYSTNETIIKSIRLYLMMRNITKALIVQQHRRSGFGYFESYSSSSFKKGKVAPYEILTSILHPTINTNIEGRTTVGKTVTKTKDKIINNIESLKEINRETGRNHQLKFIYHFLKTRDESEAARERNLEIEMKENILVRIPPKYHEPRKIYKSQATILNQLLTISDYRFHYFDEDRNQLIESNAKKIKKTDIFKKYIQGIDAANKEYHIPPEAFSAVFSFFKNSVSSSGLALDDDFFNKSTEVNLQYTFHVGEEFRDICSGLRSIFEAVIFLGLKDEDRLGHAVALGICPSVFLNERKQITLTKGEYFDNLVFMYYIFSQVAEPPISLQLLENRINRIGSTIYNSKMKNKLRFAVNDYIDAWLLRRNCPNEMSRMYKRLLGEDSDFPKVARDDDFNPKLAVELKKFISKNTDFYSCLELDNYDKIFMRSALPDFFNHIDEQAQPDKRYLTAANNLNAFTILGLYNSDPLIRVKQNEIYRGDVLFEEDVYEFLQDFVMEEIVTKKNIFVEVLPTSNVLITSIGSYENHPFIRLNPPKEIIPNKFGLRKSKVKILVGTDDPGIQGTNIMMELYHIKYLVTQKYGKEVAEKYIFKIIEQGNYIFNKS